MRTRKHTHTNTHIGMHNPSAHACIGRCTPGPLERALVTPHKSIQSLQSRRAERPSGRRGLRRSGRSSHLQTRNNRCTGGTRSPESFNVAEAKLRVYVTADRYRRRCPSHHLPHPPTPHPGSSRICVSLQPTTWRSEMFVTGT